MGTRIERPGPGAPLAALLLLLGPACGQDSPTSTTPSPPAAPAPPPSGETSEAASVPPEVSAWLDANVHPFDGSHLSLPHDDLEFLRDLVGDARIVALGENTHGTRDFFEMKAHILRFLVEEMDFDTFAIEATWPEALRLDRYVRTGEGDAAVLLSGLYLWTWNTESVLEMIGWMRDHNEAGGDLGFHGVDMQSPGMALHLVREYIGFVDPASRDSITGELDCLTRFANDPLGRRPAQRYRDQTDDYRTECGASLEGVREHLVENREQYEAAGGEDRFAVTLRSLRIAYQYHLLYSGGQSRDESMAENTVWLSDRIGPEGRMVLWAHNTHVSTQEGTHGYYQRDVFGDDMVVIGFSHENGRFTAVGLTRESAGLREFELDPPVEDSFEAIWRERRRRDSSSTCAGPWTNREAPGCPSRGSSAISAVASTPPDRRTTSTTTGGRRSGNGSTPSSTSSPPARPRCCPGDRRVPGEPDGRPSLRRRRTGPSRRRGGDHPGAPPAAAILRI